MAGTTLSKAIIPANRPIMATKTEGSVSGNIAYALFVLFCFWAGTQMLNLLVEAPGMFELHVQGSDATHPRIDMELAVGTLFGLIPFLLGSLMLGAIALVLRLRQRRRHSYFC